MALNKEERRQYRLLGYDAIRNIAIPNNPNEEAVISVLQQATRAAVMAITLDPEAAYFVRDGILAGVLKRYEEKVSPGVSVPEFRTMIQKLRRRFYKVYKAECAARPKPYPKTSAPKPPVSPIAPPVSPPTPPPPTRFGSFPTPIPMTGTPPEVPLDHESTRRKLETWQHIHGPNSLWGHMMRYVVQDDGQPQPAISVPKPLKNPEEKHQPEAKKEAPKDDKKEVKKEEAEKKKAT